jgi:hypothetical protein
LTTQQLTQPQSQTERSRLDSLLRAKDLEGLIRAADEIERKWGNAGGQNYGRLMLNVSDAIVNNFRSDQSFSLSQKYATEALAKAETFSLQLETQLLGFLARDLASASGAKSEWIRERRTKTKLWLHAWQRLEKGINRNFDFSDRPMLNVMPPQETGLPSGAAPEAIKDPKLRARYEAVIAANVKKGREYNRQFEFRYLDEIFPKRAAEYLARVYSEPPYDLAELRQYLAASHLNQPAIKNLLDEVAKRISQSQQ